MGETIIALTLFVGFVIMVICIFLDNTIAMVVGITYLILGIIMIAIAIKVDYKRKNNTKKKEKIDEIIVEDVEMPKKNFWKVVEKNKSRNNSKYTDKELDNYGLEDWQKELVKKDKYNPWNFEEEELEDDDYFKEDS